MGVVYGAAELDIYMPVEGVAAIQTDTLAPC